MKLVLDGPIQGSRIHSSFTLALVMGLFATHPSSGASLAERLEDLRPLKPVATVSGTTAKSFSGVALQPETQSLYVVDNDDAKVYVLTTAGVLQRIISTSGLTDPEGITYQGNNGFLISEEGKANIIQTPLPLSGTGPIAMTAPSATILNIGPDMANSGIEGVSYCAANKTAYAIKEINPSRLYRIALDEAGKPVESFPDEPFVLTNHNGDIADILALDDGNFLLVNQENSRLEGYDSQGKLLSTLLVTMNKVEGITLDKDSETLYLVGEPNEFMALRMDPSPLIGVSEKTQQIFLGRRVGLSLFITGKYQEARGILLGRIH
jgi:uncharacterized protein YjiK